MADLGLRVAADNPESVYEWHPLADLFWATQEVQRLCKHCLMQENWRNTLMGEEPEKLVVGLL